MFIYNSVNAIILFNVKPVIHGSMNNLCFIVRINETVGVNVFILDSSLHYKNYGRRMYVCIEIHEALCFSVYKDLYDEC